MLPKELELELERIIGQHELEEISDLIYENAESCFEISLKKKENYERVGNSRIAGYPDLPSSIKWPCTENEHYTFIAQINLSELSEDIVDYFPKQGMLYFFLGVDEPAYDISHKIFFFNGDLSELRKTLPPEGKEEVCLGYREFTSYQISFNTKICIPFESEVGEILVDKYEEAYHELCNSGDILWGQPETFSSNPKQDAYFCRNGLGKMMFNYYKSEEQIRKEAQEAKESGNTEYAQILQNEVLPLLNRL